jgi:LPS-assembly protein
MIRPVALACAFLLLTGPVTAQDSAAISRPYCPVHVEIPFLPGADPALGPGDTQITADSVELSEQGLSHLDGDVQIVRDDKVMRADTVRYDRTADAAVLEGGVQYRDGSVYLRGGRVRIDFDGNTATVTDSEYRLIEQRGHGSAAELFLDLGKLTSGTAVDYTTCTPDAAGEAGYFWKLSARRLTIDHESEQGTARDVVLRIRDVPVLYTPWLSFPVSSRRKSGFLFPGLGTGSRNGFELRVPYYWNIAPQMDATVTPRVLTDRGVMVMGEYRYLFRGGQGQVHGEFLPDDDKFRDRNRSLFGLLHEQRLGSNADLFVTFNQASDMRYFEDFGNQLGVTSTRFLERRADVVWRGDWWRAFGRVHDYQTMDETIDRISRPYTRLPQVRLEASPLRGSNRLNLSMAGEIAWFDRDEDPLPIEDVAGLRIDVQPSISYPLRSRAAFLTPSAGLRYTKYSLEDSGPFRSSPDRLLPVVSVDGGVFLERELALGGATYLQTLEPRFFYLYVADNNQNALPVFDTAINDLSWDAMFRDNRFSGADRVGDANQITLALTTRLLDGRTGAERAWAAIGQSWHFDKQTVLRQRFNRFGLLEADGRLHDDFLGPIVGEVGVNLFGGWNLHGELHWEPNDNRSEKLALRAQYRPGDGRVLNLGYRLRRLAPGEIRSDRVNIEHTDLSFRWPLARQWNIVGRWNYAIPQDRTLELFGGIEYESCCWGIRAGARRFLSSRDGDFSTGVFLQVELKGLAGIGRSTVDMLTQRIPGYEEEF